MLPKEAYIKTVRRPYPPLFASMFMHGYKSPAQHQDFLLKKYAMVDLILLDGEWYYPKKQLDTAGRYAFESWYDQKCLDRIIGLFYGREQALIKTTKGNFKEYSAAYEAYIPAVLLVWAVEGRVTAQIKKLLRKKLSERETDKLMDDLNVPLRDNYYKQEEYDLLEAKDLGAHVKKYEWINSRYGEIKPYTLTEARKKLRGIDSKKFLKDWAEQKKRIKKSIAYAKSLLTAKDRIIVDLMQYIIYYRTQRTDIVNMSHYLFVPGLKALAKQKNISYQELLYCAKDEVLGTIPSQEELQNRIIGHAMVMESGKIFCVAGKEYGKVKDWFAEHTKNITHVRGRVACAGNVKGKVRIITGSKDFPLFQKGEILVTSMTNPHMVPIMKKAAAFVTDEGGITCHAAIMSREMKKPCVIGTKIATKVLKDGDLVEVDADNGIVRKIK